MKTLRSRSILLLLFLIVSLSSPAGRSAARQVPSLPGQFSYVEDGSRLYLVRGNVDQAILLLQTESGTIVSNPHFSTDGRFLAYCIHTPSTGNPPVLYYLDSVTLEKIEVTQEGSCSYDWSPDGETLIYSTPASETPSAVAHGIWSYSRETKEIKLTVPSEVPVIDPRWPSGGTTLSYFDFCFECVGQFYTYDIGTGQKQEWSQEGTDEYIGPDVDWSPDGNTLAYDKALWMYTGEGETYPLGLASRDGTTRTEIYSQPGQGAYFPVWSPDGRYIAFAAYESFTIGNFVNRRGDLMVISPNGSNARRLYSSIYEVFPQAWSPDGRYLLFVEPQSMPQDTLQKQQLVLLDAEGGSVLWKKSSLGSLTADWAPIFTEAASQSVIATPSVPAAETTTPMEPANAQTGQTEENSRVVMMSILLWAGALIGIGVLMVYLWRYSAAQRKQPRPPEAQAPIEEKPAPAVEPAREPSREDVEKLFQEGVELVHAGNAEGGIARLRQVIAVEPENDVAWFWLGIASVRQRDFRSAERCFLQAKRRGHPEADKALEWLRKQII